MKRCKYYCLAMTLMGFALLYGCSTKTVDTDVEVITVNPNEATEYVNISEIADSVQCIRLQTAPDDVLGRVAVVYVRKKYIYALDASQEMVFVFDKTGKYVAKLNKKGQGPGEYSSIAPIHIDDNEEFIELIDDRRATTVKLKYANISFECVESKPFPKIRDMFRKHKGIYYFAGQQLDNIINDKKTNAGLFIFNEKENTTKILFDKTIETKGNCYAYNVESFARNDKNELFMSIMFDNTFYRLEADTAYPAYRIDFGKYGMENSMGMQPLDRQVQYVLDMTGEASFPVLSMNNSDIMAFSYYFKDEANRLYKEEDYRHYVKNRKTNTVYHTKKFKNDITNFPDHVFISSNYLYFCGHDVWQDKYFVDVLFPEQYLLRHNKDKMFVEGIGEIDIEDNPIVVLMKMKE